MRPAEAILVRDLALFTYVDRLILSTYARKKLLTSKLSELVGIRLSNGTWDVAIPAIVRRCLPTRVFTLCCAVWFAVAFFRLFDVDKTAVELASLPQLLLLMLALLFFMTRWKVSMSYDCSVWFEYLGQLHLF